MESPAISNSSESSAEESIYFHTPDGVEDDDISLDLDEDLPPSMASPAELPSPVGFCMPLLLVPTHKGLACEITPKHKQFESDLWQARLGHFSMWGVKVIPMSTTGTLANMTPHLFASNDHYNQAHICKLLATWDKHPSRSNTSKQWYMDFGFLCASQEGY